MSRRGRKKKCKKWKEREWLGLTFPFSLYANNVYLGRNRDWRIDETKKVQSKERCDVKILRCHRLDEANAITGSATILGWKSMLFSSSSQVYANGKTFMSTRSEKRF